MTYISEKYQLGILEPFLEECYDEFVTEAYVYSVPIDIIAKDGTDTVSIELKSKDHKRGIAQAKRNTAFSDFSYLCIWETHLTEYLREEIQKSPIGLIAVDNNVEVIQEGERLDPSPHAKETTLQVFKDDI